MRLMQFTWWLIAAALCAQAASLTAEASGRDAESTPGYVYNCWAPLKGNSFRVNSPDTATGRFKDRWEAKQTGLMTIDIDAPLERVKRAELYLELWGGHPGVAKKRFTLNGRSEYALPEVGAAAKNCTYSYPRIALKLDELRRGENAFQFTCERGSTFWGHYLIRAAGVRLYLDDGHPSIADHAAPLRLEATGRGDGTIELQLRGDGKALRHVAAVDFFGRYHGYDENGDGRSRDWHGFTKDRKPTGHLGTVSDAPFTTTWDTAMLPDQPTVSARAVVHFTDAPNLAYETNVVNDIALPRRATRVAMFRPADLPRPFWSRAGNAQMCEIDLPIDPSRIERAALFVLIWDGGKGDTKDPFTLNGHALNVAGAGKHDVLYRVITIDPAMLKRGGNTIRIMSDTTHHGIEVLLPGPALMVRYRPD